LEAHTSSAYVLKTPELISMIFGTPFILDASADSKFINFIIWSGATWWKL